MYSLETEERIIMLIELNAINFARNISHSFIFQNAY